MSLGNPSLEGSSNLSFVNNFFNITYDEDEEISFNNFIEAHKLFNKGLNKKQISDELNINHSTICRWINFKSVPFLAKLLEYSEHLKYSKNKWVSLNSTRGGLFIGPWISVPIKINDIKDIEKVLSQIDPLENYYILSNKYKTKDRLFLFFYLLGIIIGDSSKHPIKRKNRINRRIQLRLTKRYPSCKNLGEFTVLCLNNLGLKMNRCKDCPGGKNNTHDFYAWHSQCSLLIEWIFTVVLGFKTNNLTTYDKINCDWLLDIDKKYKIAFVQGLSDSDGYLDITTKRAGIISGPNTDFIIELLSSIGIKSNKYTMKQKRNFHLDFLTMSMYDAYSLPLFNDNVKLYRYNLMKKFIEAKRIPRPFPDWLDKKVNYLISKNYSSTKIINKILEEDNIVISQGGIRKRVNKMKKLVTLGIESTAL
jgi:hypothetical protein